jgi:uncharacterized lipoprotein YbaY
MDETITFPHGPIAMWKSLIANKERVIRLWNAQGRFWLASRGASDLANLRVQLADIQLRDAQFRRDHLPA